MIDYNISDVSLRQVLMYLLFGLLSAVIAYIITHYLLPILSRHKYSRMLIWQRTQIVFWLVYVGLLFVILFRINMFVTIAMSIVIFGAGWNYWRNVFSGLVIKLNTQLRIGDVIDIEFARGELRSIGLSQSELINESGELVVVPNYKLRTSVVRHLNKKTNVQMHAFNISVSAQWTLEAMKNLALECPFVSANQKIEVERLSSDEVVVRAAVIDNAFIDNVNLYFQKACSASVIV